VRVGYKMGYKPYKRVRRLITKVTGFVSLTTKQMCVSKRSLGGRAHAEFSSCLQQPCKTKVRLKQNQHSANTLLFQNLGYGKSKSSPAMVKESDR
jgi:hypothetical protein